MLCDYIIIGLWCVVGVGVLFFGDVDVDGVYIGIKMECCLVFSMELWKI